MDYWSACIGPPSEGIEPTQCAELTANLSAGFFSVFAIFGTPPKPSRYRAKPQWYRVIRACNN